MRRLTRSAAFYVVLALVVLALAASVLGRGQGREKLSLSQFERAVAEKRVQTAEIIDGDDKVRGELKNGRAYEAKYPAEYVDELTSSLKAAGVDYDAKPKKDNVWLSLLINFLPFVLIIVLFFFVMNSMQGGGNRVMQFGKAKPKTVSKDQPKVTFADVAGADEAVAELEEIKEFLESPAKFQAIGAKIPKGVLLYGPPGTGKTLLARAVAGEAGAPFYSISGSDFVEMFVGVGASRVRDLFEQAKATAPAIIFMD
jgi:cell division protease FtsH